MSRDDVIRRAALDAEALPWRLSWWSGWCADHTDEHPELAILGGLLMDAKNEILEHRRECP